MMNTTNTASGARFCGLPKDAAYSAATRNAVILQNLVNVKNPDTQKGQRELEGQSPDGSKKVHFLETARERKITVTGFEGGPANAVTIPLGENMMPQNAQQYSLFNRAVKELRVSYPDARITPAPGRPSANLAGSALRLNS